MIFLWLWEDKVSVSVGAGVSRERNFVISVRFCVEMGRDTCTLQKGAECWYVCIRASESTLSLSPPFLTSLAHKFSF